MAPVTGPVNLIPKVLPPQGEPRTPPVNPQARRLALQIVGALGQPEVRPTLEQPALQGQDIVAPATPSIYEQARRLYEALPPEQLVMHAHALGGALAGRTHYLAPT